jgi:hypothetical protein
MPPKGATMGLSPDDALPVGISVRDAYAAVREWYLKNARPDLVDEGLRELAAAARGYIESLPVPEAASQEEMRECLEQVKAGDLEFAYHASDGEFKMAAYAEAALGEDRN